MNSVTNFSFSVKRDPGGRPIGINRRPSPSTSVGARAADEGLGGPLWSPASCSTDSNLAGTRPPPHPAGDHKGPPFPSSSSLAPTDRPASRLSSRLRLMPIGRPPGSPLQFLTYGNCQTFALAKATSVGPVLLSPKTPILPEVRVLLLTLLRYWPLT